MIREPLAPEGEVHFEYDRSPSRIYTLGLGEYGFKLCVSGHAAQSVYVLNDHIHAVGLNRTGATITSHGDLADQLTPGRSVVASVGHQIILQNEHGTLCLTDLLDVHPEQTEPDYTPASIQFRYRILLDS